MFRILKKILLFTGIGIFLLLLILPAPAGLGRPAQNALAVFSLCVSLWATNVLPMSITGLIAIAAIPLFNIAEGKTTFSHFGNSAVFFILGAFILATAMMKSGLSKRLAIVFLRQFDRSANTLAIGILLTSFFLAFWMPEHAVASLLFPIVLEISKSLDLKPHRSNYAKILFLSLAWGTVIGGVCTFLGGARNPLAIGMLKESYDLNIGFLEWMIAVVPVVLILLLFAYIVINMFFKKEIKSIDSASESLSDSVRKMGAFSRNELKVAIIVVVTIAAWIFLNKQLDIAVIALLSAISLFVFRAVTWKDIERYINWGIILMYGGAVTLGSTLAETGAMDWFARKIFSYVSLTPFSAVTVLSLLSKFMTEGISNVAAVATLIPLGFGIADTLQINPIIIVQVIAIQSGLAFCLPIGTPPNAIAYSSGYFSISDFVKGGIILNILAILIFLIIGLNYWNLIGINIQ
ncbi:DASS family sodium-coupled anion symporter [candidate division KSB1 bacterium]|nr:DASS family sodium-coupled anion symporter [candidate division KSB1 bacterium]